MDYLLIGLAGALFAAILRIRASWCFSLAEASVHLLDAFLAPGTDDEKLPLIGSRTRKLTGSLFRVVALLLIAGLIAAIPPVLWDILVATDRPFAPSGLWNIAALSVGATLPLILPLGSRSKSAYLPLARLLHRLALDNPNVGMRLQRRDVKAADKQGIERKNEFLIITGLARAGTTSLLNTLMPLGDFASLNYGNMPFVLAPGTWARFYKPRGDEVRERSHGDGVMIGLGSDEALEEVFFKAVTQDSFIGGDCLKEHELSREAYERYLDYQRIIRGSNERMYVAKNNCFLLRYRSVRKYNPDFRVAILFRDPLYHAASLMEKHQQYSEMQQNDPFVLEYMNWLGHHEFGLGQKALCFNDESEMALKYRDRPKDSIDYWLSIWVSVYQFTCSINDPNTLFVSYREFCQDPSAVVRRLTSGFVSIREDGNVEPFYNRRKAEYTASEELLAEAHRIFQLLQAKTGV